MSGNNLVLFPSLAYTVLTGCCRSRIQKEGEGTTIENEIRLSIFSDNQFNTLTMLYLKKQDLSELTPEQLLDKYDETYHRIRTRYEDTRANRNLVEWV